MGAMAEDQQPPTKRARSAEEEEEETVAEGALRPEDLEAGTLVLYFGNKRGRIHDAFEEEDTFWVAEEESGEIVRGPDGQIFDFKAAQLQLVAARLEDELPEQTESGPVAGVLLLGTEEHMRTILEYTGEPNFQERTMPQTFLAIPCSDCQPQNLIQLAVAGIDDKLRYLARKLRSDIRVTERVDNLKKALRELGADLPRLQDYFLLSSVLMPFGWEDIQGASSRNSQYQRKEVWNQIDLCVTAMKYEVDEGRPPEESHLAAARNSLGELCGIQISDMLWDPDVQKAVRKELGVELLPQTFNDTSGNEVYTIILPKDVVATRIKGILCFTEAPGAKYAKKKEAEAEKNMSKAAGGKTIRDWASSQDEFAHLPKLPPDWIRIKSRKDDSVYYWNQKTQKASFEFPKDAASTPSQKAGASAAPAKANEDLPPGWAKQVSKSTGKVYYWHAGKQKSMFERPTE
eukprot:TRINITY_DN104615_c0_g1_i1.p1 TRINITY_DN104615_c0_g1~~TRINITY_DN104615_c0_g1_i1.p1  ORF type:complete len:460 (+),score=110.42 TRINITY_DN104615_c0_g1_i1:34-1413(+)